MASSITDKITLVKFDKQVAGHDRLLRFSTHDLMIIKPCTQTELRFYEESQKHPEFLNWIPECYGSLRASTESEVNMLKEKGHSNLEEGVASIPLAAQARPVDAQGRSLEENVLHGFTRPCVMDIKLGNRLYADDADEAKKARMIEKARTTTSGTMAVRISGMETYSTADRTWHMYSKDFGRSRKDDNLLDAFLAFFFPASKYAQGNEPTRTLVKDEETKAAAELGKPISGSKIRWILECMIEDVQAIRDYAAKQPGLELIGSSLLLVFEGDKTAADLAWKRMLEEDKRAEAAGSKNDDDDDDDGKEDEDKPKMYDLRLIDFAHSQWDAKRTTQDEGLLKGLDNVMSILEQCQTRQREEKL